MKNTIRIIISLLLILFLSSCRSESNYDINEFLIKLNEKYGYDFQTEDFTVHKNKQYIYSTCIDNSLLLIFYCNDKNEIKQCTLTAEKDCKAINTLSQQIADIISDTTDNLNATNTWEKKTIENKVGTTIIINKSNSEIHTNIYPKLKDYKTKSDKQ